MFVANSASGGGAELASRILCAKLNSPEFPCSYVAINDWPDDGVVFTSDLIRIGRRYKGNIINLGISALKFYLVVRKRKPDILVLNCELPELFSLIAPSSCKRIVVEHTSKPWIRLRLLGFIVRRRLTHLQTTWVTVSKDGEIWGVHSVRPIHIPNLIVHDLAKLDGRLTRIQRLFFVGRLNSIKQPSFILKASQASGIPAILIGDGPEFKTLEKQIFEKSLDVTLHGHSSRPWDQLRLGDLVIVPSLYEGDGLVVSEAIMMGAPLLLLDTPDLRKFNLPDKSYFLDSQELIHKIEHFENIPLEILPSPEILHAQIKERSPNFILDCWKLLFESLSKAP